MKKNFFKAMLLAAAFAMVMPIATAGAQEKNAYVTPKILFSVQEGDIKGPGLNLPLLGLASVGLNLDYLADSSDDTTFGVGFSVGTYLRKDNKFPIRVELEYLYRGEATLENKAGLDFSAIIPPDVDNGIAGGISGFHGFNARQKFDVTTHTLMANAFIDFKTGTSVTPYIGGGIGIAYTDSSYSLSGGATMATIDPGPPAATLETTTYGIKTSDSENNIDFAWNIGAGVAWAITDAIALDFGYRYYDFGDGAEGTAKNLGLPMLKAQLSDYKAHEFSLGLRYSF